MRARAVNVANQLKGPKKFNLIQFRSDIRESLRSKDLDKLNGVLSSVDRSIVKSLRNDEQFRYDVKRILESNNKNLYGVDAALVCYRNGLSFEPVLEDPITTNTILCTAQEMDIWKAVELATHALLFQAKVDTKILLCTLVDADEDLTSKQKINSFVRLAGIAINHFDLKDTSVIGTYNVILAKLGDPTSGRDIEERELSFVLDRIQKGVKLVDKLIDRGIRFSHEDPEVRLRMNNFIRGVRTVSEELSQSVITDEPLIDDLFRAIGLDFSSEEKVIRDSNKLMGEAFRLMAECLGEYEIKGETVNSSFSSLFTNRILLDDELLKSVDNVFQKSVDIKQIRIHLNSTTMNVLLKYILDSNCEDKFNVAVRMIDKASSYGYKFHDEIISRIDQGSVIKPAVIAKPRKPKEKLIQPLHEPEEINGFIPVSIMRRFFPDYKPESISRLNLGLRGGLGKVSSY